MRELALPKEVLMAVEKPARTIGNEVNSVVKDVKEVDVRFCICFPDVYEIGMSHLGVQVLYDLFNQLPKVWCERVYSPWVDLDKQMREKGISLFALESQDPIKEFDFLGFTVQYEMCATNILQVLDLGQIPLRSKDRGEEYPIVMGGGPTVYNPEPLADFFDVFYIGEGEEVLPEFIEQYKIAKREGLSKREFLERAVKLEGIYVPSFYDVTYGDEGTIKEFKRNNKFAPEKVKKQAVRDFEGVPYPVKPVVPFIQVTQDRVVLEIQRGCIRGCRFCQGGMVYRPTRGRDVERLKENASQLLKNTGYQEISLGSLSSSDYLELEELVNYLIEECQGKGINISLPSLRIDSFSLEVMSKVQDVKKSSLTFAPEAGSQRLRDVINKGLTQEMILSGAGLAFESGWTKVKLYFMLGLPTETEEDIRAIPQLCQEIAKRYYEIPKEERTGKCQINISTSFFIPKPFTPFQWCPMELPKEYIRRAHVLKDELGQQLNRKSMKFNWHEADVTLIEGALARGDRRLSTVIERAYRLGCLYDSWSEWFNNELWLQAFEETGMDLNFYTTRARDFQEILPWDFIDIGVTKEFLIKEWNRAMAEEVTPHCRQKCSGCGANKLIRTGIEPVRLGGGVCFESKN